jgi:hypothetical protein
MKATELIEVLSRDVAQWGDREVVLQCDDLETEKPVGAVGFLVEQDGTKKYVLHCAECHYQFLLDEQSVDYH